MDPHSFIARAEAQRWLGIAEKLLMGNDLVGSKTFAIRARESDPRLEAADQILAVADTLLAADKRVVGANGSQQPDFYAILQLVRFVQDPEHISAQYRRLAVLLNPHQNRFPYADQAFQVVNDAWAVLSNPMRKSIYDSDLEFSQHQQQVNNLGFNIIEPQNQHHHHQQQHQQQHQHNFFSVNRNEQEMFQSRVPVQSVHHHQEQQQQQQLHQHNFMSVPVREPEQLFQHRGHEQLLFQQQVQPFSVTVESHQQTRPAAPFSWPQAPPQVPPPAPLSQMQHQFEAASHINRSNDVREGAGMEVEAEAETETADENVDVSASFWTTCPYCYYMYEYPRAYVECVLRCETCERAFQAVSIPSPPMISEDQESYYYCWGFFPLAISMSHMEKSKNNGSTQTNSKWSPFSPMCDVTSHVKDQLNKKAKEDLNEEAEEEDLNEEAAEEEDHLNEKAAPKKKVFVNQNLGPPIYIDDETDDIFDGISEPSDDSDSDLEWNTTEKKKAKKMKKDRVKEARNGNAKNASSLRSSRKSSGVTTRRQSVRAAKEMGRLDLNVEFNNNEGEEPAARAGAGNRGNGQGDGDNIEGIGFFEGLDEFFSSLPILSVVNDDKVKAA
ncbi:putative DnaJ domain, Chaperone J-domain superfamily [Helianthus annuus]|nr:putative DnaJ domain, Chaperone J-domain superfamily [Helianthus annuus]KAJ0874322.1 putative DnaJ domain, Chaperone J-domain superfamily [Helianthus annuus]